MKTSPSDLEAQSGLETSDLDPMESAFSHLDYSLNCAADPLGHATGVARYFEFSARNYIKMEARNVELAFSPGMHW